MSYQVWAFTEAGVKSAILENAFGINRTEKENCAPTCSFSLPADDPKAVYLTKAYEIKIWNTIKSRFEGIYILDDSTDKWSSSGSVIECNYSGVISQLVAEDNISYDSTATPKTPTQIVSALLALQTNTTTPITVGTIEPTTAFSLAVENTNILKALLEAVCYLGGRIEVDDTRALNWYAEPAIATPTREIRYRKNMIGVTRKREYTSIANRIYAYGYGETEAQVTLIDSGEADEYIEDVTSQAVYGTQIRRITDKRITHPSTLLRWAQRILGQYKDPIFSYQVDVANLAVHPDFDFDLEDLEVGQVVRVVNSDLIDPLTGLGLNVNVKIVSVTTDLSIPHNITVELANATKSLSDSIAASADTSSVVNNIATQIGAGQVTVQGTFTVDGWRTSGKTTIDGGNITANTITVNQLNFTPITGTNVVATINASSEGIKITGSKISISGLTTFANGYDPSTKIATGLAAADVNTYTTTIDGGKITAHTISAYQIAANTITVSELNFVPATSTNILATINASSEGIKITGSKITLAGTVALTDDIKTTDFVSGSAGWRIKGDGSAEFNNVTVRGAVYAASGEFSGTLKTTNLYSSSTLSVHGTMQSDSYVADTSGWKIQGSGTVEFNSVKLRGNLESTNWASTAGSQINMTNGTFKMGGSSDPALSWNGTTLVIKGTLKTTVLDTGNTMTVKGTLQSDNYVADTSGWKITGAGVAEFKDVILRGNLDSQNWTTTAGVRIDVDLGKIWCGGSLAPKLYWNGSTLTVEGTIKATSGEFTGTLKTSNIDASHTLTVNGTVQSTTFTAGSAGWQIKGDGSAEFNNVTVRGAVYASSGEFSGSLKAATIAGSQSIIISSTGVVKSSNFSSGSAGFQIKGDGSAEFSNVVVRGELHSTAAQLVMSGFTQGAGYMPNNSLATDGTNLYFKNNSGAVWQLN